MATIKHFEEIIAWQKARELCRAIKPLADRIEEGRDYRMKDQILASSGSIMDNIAEGFERSGNREFRQFLYIAKGSCGEVRSQLYRALDHGFLDDVTFLELKNRTLEISRILHGFIASLDNSGHGGYKRK